MTEPVVSIRPVEDDDLPIFLAHEQDPVASAMAVYPPRPTDAFYKHWATLRSSPTAYLRTILADETVVGRMMSWVHDGVREVGYWIGRDFWGHGYATSALRLVLEEITDRPIVAHIALHNIGSQRVVEHCGFRRVAEIVGDDGVIEATYRLD